MKRIWVLIMVLLLLFPAVSMAEDLESLLNDMLNSIKEETAAATSAPAPTQTPSDLSDLMDSLLGKEAKKNVKHEFVPLSPFSEGKAFVKMKDETVAVIDKTGTVLFALPKEIEVVEVSESGFVNGTAVFYAMGEDGKSTPCVVNAEGKILVEPGVANRIEPADELGCFRVSFPVDKSRFQYEYILYNTDGLEAIPGVWEGISTSGFSEGLLAVAKNGYWGYVDTMGSVQIDYTWNCAGDFENGLAAVRNNEGLYGCIDTEGNLVVDCQWDALMTSQNGWIKVEKDDLWAFVKADATAATGLEWEMLSDFSHGFAAAKKEDGWHYFLNEECQVALEGDWIIEGLFTEEGLALIEMNGLYGYINTEGEIVIPCEWDVAYDFKDGLAMVGKDGWAGFINTQGEFVVPMEWNDGYPYVSDGLVLVMNHKTEVYRFYDTQGNVVLECGL